MKKSEMIMDLATELICCTPNIDYKEAKEIASKLLNRAEENGMMPPYDNRGLRVNSEALNYCEWKDED